MDVTFTNQKINLAFNYKDLPHSLTYTLLLSKGKSTLITEVQCIKSDLSLVNAILMLEPVYLEYLDRVSQVKTDKEWIEVLYTNYNFTKQECRAIVDQGLTIDFEHYKLIQLQLETGIEYLEKLIKMRLSN
jgi:hypothetical protein